MRNKHKLLTESTDKYIPYVSELDLFVGIEVKELSQALIRGLPTILKWHVVSFTTLNESIQRILLGEATLSFGDNEHINVVSENGMTTTVQTIFLNPLNCL